MLGDHLVPVGREFGVAVLAEDLQHLSALTGTTIGFQPEPRSVRASRRPPVRMRPFMTTMRPVFVREHLPPAYQLTKILERQPLRMLQQHRQRIRQPGTTPRIRERRSQQLDLSDTHLTGRHHLRNRRMRTEEPAHPQPHHRLGPRPRRRYPRPPLHRPMPRISKHPPLLTHVQHLRDLHLQTPQLTHQQPQPASQPLVIELTRRHRTIRLEPRQQPQLLHRERRQLLRNRPNRHGIIIHSGCHTGLPRRSRACHSTTIASATADRRICPPVASRPTRK